MRIMKELPYQQPPLTKLPMMLEKRLWITRSSTSSNKESICQRSLIKLSTNAEKNVTFWILVRKRKTIQLWCRWASNSNSWWLCSSNNSNRYINNILWWECLVWTSQLLLCRHLLSSLSQQIKTRWFKNKAYIRTWIRIWCTL